ncbi:hypothetical protein OG590_40485 (plasmid) [Streptomyces goshikiensis]|uniref:hypothetical protein n=1 Tax=Streptomyces goshikiensis TaxID=1942 RepID=UPI002F91886D|nr:hypothetical protein OG590_40485 [Streptomyces goshikiensis]
MTPETIGRHCQACGHPYTETDPVMVLEAGVRIHTSHATTPGNGFYGVRAACDCGASTAPTPKPHSLDCAVHFPQQSEEEWNARHRAHVTAGQEYAEAHPDYDPWQSGTPEERADFTLYMTARVPELLEGPLLPRPEGRP